jgi:RHS repeat-associated protein
MAVKNYCTMNGQLIGEYEGTRSTDYILDGLGSVIATFRSTGTIQNQYRYSGYGQQVYRSGTGTDPYFLWVGGWGYRTRGMVYVRRRTYYEQAAVWTSVDPLWPGESAYGYVRCFPTLSVDPSGLQREPPREQSCTRRDWNDTCRPIRRATNCCVPIILCQEQPSRLTFTMTIPRSTAPARLRIGRLSARIFYTVRWASLLGLDCPPDESFFVDAQFTATSGTLDNQFYDRIHTPDGGGPIPDSAPGYDFYVYTACQPTIEPGVCLGRECFKFRIGSATSNNPTWPDRRSRFLVHPDEAPDGTAGCIGLRSVADSHNFRSCMHWAREHTCLKLPLTVQYTIDP